MNSHQGLATNKRDDIVSFRSSTEPHKQQAKRIIPKVIYQTWRTKILPESIQLVRKHVKLLNPDYDLQLFDDKDISDYIDRNFSKKVFNAFKQLNSGAARADFWRYCILWNEGGIYLDIDSRISKNIDELINPSDQFIVTREGNPEYFNNWILISCPRHPILLECIVSCCDNIHNKRSNNTCLLTGPWGPYTKAINIFAKTYAEPGKTPYQTDDEYINSQALHKNSPVKFRFYGQDLNEYGIYKHTYHEDLYKTNTHWSQQTALKGSQ